MQIFVAAGSGRKSRWKFFLEIFSWKFFLSARPKIFSFPKLGFNLFLSKGRRSFPISLSSLCRLKLSQICEDFYSENLGSEDLIFKWVFYYALIGHLSKILIWKLDTCTSKSYPFSQNLSAPIPSLYLLPQSETFGLLLGLLLNLSFLFFVSFTRRNFISTFIFYSSSSSSPFFSSLFFLF